MSFVPPNWNGLGAGEGAVAFGTSPNLNELLIVLVAAGFDAKADPPLPNVGIGLLLSCAGPPNENIGPAAMVDMVVLVVGALLIWLLFVVEPKPKRFVAGVDDAVVEVVAVPGIAGLNKNCGRAAVAVGAKLPEPNVIDCGDVAGGAG